MGKNRRGAAPVGDPLIAHLKRQERSVTSRIGAGMPLAEAMQAERWVRELSDDVTCSKEESSLFIDLIIANVTKAVGPLRDKPSRVAATRLVYAHYVEAMRGRTVADPQQVGKHMVYLLYAEDGSLLYVGITDRGPTRLAEHYRHKPWFHLVCRVEFERYQTRDGSEAREKYLIQKLSPLHNIQHNRGRKIA